MTEAVKPHLTMFNFTKFFRGAPSVEHLVGFCFYFLFLALSCIVSLILSIF